MNRPQSQPSAREVLRCWARARGYSDRAAEFLQLARNASLPAVRKRYITIAEHYRTLAEVEKRVRAKEGRTPDLTLRKPGVAGEGALGGCGSGRDLRKIGA